jgi:ATP-dependent Clp protease ATP-binding subunit ClpC
MTSNAGAREISHSSNVGFKVEEGFMSYTEIKASAMNELKRLFRPEFINRVDEIVVFHSLNHEQLKTIVEIMLEEVRERVHEMNMLIDVSRQAKEYIIEHGYEAKYGARPLRRVIQKDLEDPLSVEILRGRFISGDTIAIGVRNGKISFRLKNREKKQEQKAPEPILN